MADARVFYAIVAKERHHVQVNLESEIDEERSTANRKD